MKAITSKEFQAGQSWSKLIETKTNVIVMTDGDHKITFRKIHIDPWAIEEEG